MTCLFQIFSILISVVLISVTEAVDNKGFLMTPKGTICVINSSFNTRTNSRQQLLMLQECLLTQNYH